MRDADMGASELVLEIGAGTGRLTTELARVARQVLAVEIDARLAEALRCQFAATNVTVVEVDAVSLPLPTDLFRAVANVPFHPTTSILPHLLDNPEAAPTRANLIVEWGAARKRWDAWPSALLGATYGAWYTFALVRSVTSACFSPRPSPCPVPGTGDGGFGHFAWRSTRWPNR